MYDNLAVESGDEIKLPCHVSPPSATANVTWLHSAILEYGPPLVNDIYVNGRFIWKVHRRFSIYDAAAGDYSLKILNIKGFDAGRYRCFDQAQLINNYVVYVSGE